MGVGAAALARPAWARGFRALSLNSYGQDSFAGHAWGTQKDSDAAYAIQEDLAFTPRRHRFEVRKGDTWQQQAGINRAEFSCLTKHDPGEDVWFSYAMRIRAGSPVTDWNVLGQFHHTPDPDEGGSSPPFAINLIPGEKLRFVRRYNPLPLDAQPTTSVMHTRTVVRDRWYRIVGCVRFGWRDNGAVRIWLDGSRIVSLSNTNIGYNDATGPYFKFGIYRANVAETLVVDYANLEFGNSSLAGRVSGPLPI